MEKYNKELIETYLMSIEIYSTFDNKEWRENEIKIRTHNIRQLLKEVK